MFSTIREGAVKIVNALEGGAVNFFTMTEHFNCPPTVIVDTSLILTFILLHSTKGCE